MLARAAPSGSFCQRENVKTPSLDTSVETAGWRACATLSLACLIAGGAVEQIVQLVEPAIGDHALHFVRIGDIFERVAVDDHDVGQFAGFDAAGIEVRALRPN